MATNAQPWTDPNAQGGWASPGVWVSGDGSSAYSQGLIQQTQQEAQAQQAAINSAGKTSPTGPFSMAGSTGTGSSGMTTKPMQVPASGTGYVAPVSPTAGGLISQAQQAASTTAGSGASTGTTTTPTSTSTGGTTAQGYSQNYDADSLASIRAAWAANQNNPTAISQAMGQFNVSANDIALALGIPVSQVNSFLGSGTGTTTTPSTTAATAGSVTPWNVTANQTVANQIASLTDPNSPLIAQARAQALAGMNARGLTNSSIAQTAADSAAYNAALPIATADAATYAKAAGYNVDQANQLNLQAQQLQNATNIANLQASTSLAQTAANNASSQSIAALNNQSSQLIAKMNSDTQKQVQESQNAYNKLINTNNQAATAYNNYAAQMAAVDANTSMDANTKTQAKANLSNVFQQQMNTISKTSGVDLSATLSFANYPGFDAQGNFVGFNADGTTKGTTSTGTTSTATTGNTGISGVGGI